MKSGLEAGCVALVIDLVNPENVGKSVTLLSWFEAGEFLTPQMVPVDKCPLTQAAGCVSVTLYVLAKCTSR